MLEPYDYVLVGRPKCFLRGAGNYILNVNDEHFTAVGIVYERHADAMLPERKILEFDGFSKVSTPSNIEEYIQNSKVAVFELMPKQASVSVTSSLAGVGDREGGMHEQDQSQVGNGVSEEHLFSDGVPACCVVQNGFLDWVTPSQQAARQAESASPVMFQPRSDSDQDQSVQKTRESRGAPGDDAQRQSQSSSD
eukprot:8906512-Karenia_brevis.AAC.1